MHLEKCHVIPSFYHELKVVDLGWWFGCSWKNLTLYFDQWKKQKKHPENPESSWTKKIYIMTEVWQEHARMAILCYTVANLCGVLFLQSLGRITRFKKTHTNCLINEEHARHQLCDSLIDVPGHPNTWDLPLFCFSRCQNLFPTESSRLVAATTDLVPSKRSYTKLPAVPVDHLIDLKPQLLGNLRLPRLQEASHQTLQILRKVW